ncbi:unnamed protein product [Fraxinus pennsylvanica]|uniref:Small auxin up regulated protein n=1 Tax=Fraxinus pennsylvanica TaxID=56036 RepID=A0AAD2DWL5_9LAMI|nr:unnamed protein product [Fraxinus pennsylvanica]
MAKGGKLSKLKSMLKKMQSFKLRRANSSSVVATNNFSDDDEYSHTNAAKNLHPVYVGKSRRRYMITSDVLDNPLFRELVEYSSDGEDTIKVGCEVPDSSEEMVEFYAC